MFKCGAGGPLLKQFAILMSSLATAISTSLLLTGPGRISIESVINLQFGLIYPLRLDEQ